MLKTNFMVIYMEELQKDKFRYERKYIIQNVELPSFIFEIQNNGFLEVFNERKINNLYYDSINFNSILDNIDGLSNRKKFRVRWYGDTFKNSFKQFEIKFKSEFLNSKKIINIGKYQIKNHDDFHQTHEKLLEILKKNDLPLFFEMRRKSIKLYNSYKRKYFLSGDKKIRITIDKELRFYSPMTKNKFEENNIIVEIKYDKDSKFINELNYLRLNKYSKYVKGVTSTSFYNPMY